jgi:hypothetical protein
MADKGFSIDISPALMHLLVNMMGGPQGGMAVGMGQTNPGMIPEQPKQQDPLSGLLGGKGGGGAMLPMLAMSMLQRNRGGAGGGMPGQM